MAMKIRESMLAWSSVALAALATVACTEPKYLAVANSSAVSASSSDLDDSWRDCWNVFKNLIKECKLEWPNKEEGSEERAICYQGATIVLTACLRDLVEDLQDPTTTWPDLTDDFLLSLDPQANTYTLRLQTDAPADSVVFFMRYEDEQNNTIFVEIGSGVEDPNQAGRFVLVSDPFEHEIDHLDYVTFLAQVLDTNADELLDVAAADAPLD